MLHNSQPRALRYPKYPSLSIITSDQDLNKPSRPQGLAISPYLGGTNDRNSVVSPVLEYEQSTNVLERAQYPHYNNITHQVSGDIMSKSENSCYSQADPRPQVPPPVYGGNSPLSPTASTIKDFDTCAEGDVFVKSQWMWMLLHLDKIPTWHNIFVAASTWIILAAYLVLPGTFTTLKRTESPSAQGTDFDKITHAFTAGIDHLGLAVFSGILAGSGALGCLIMWYANWKNYLWLSWKIFMPLMLNSYAGLLTTLVNVYTAQNGIWSITAKINAIMSGSMAGFASVIYLFYMYYLLRRVKKEHDEQFPEAIELVGRMKIGRIWKRNKSTSTKMDLEK